MPGTPKQKDSVLACVSCHTVERIVLDEETEAISATKIRGLSAAPGSV